jgi:hypothetical protein
VSYPVCGASRTDSNGPVTTWSPTRFTLPARSLAMARTGYTMGRPVASRSKATSNAKVASVSLAPPRKLIAVAP